MTIRILTANDGVNNGRGSGRGRGSENGTRRGSENYGRGRGSATGRREKGTESRVNTRESKTSSAKGRMGRHQTQAARRRSGEHVLNQMLTRSPSLHVARHKPIRKERSKSLPSTHSHQSPRLMTMHGTHGTGIVRGNQTWSCRVESSERHLPYRLPHRSASDRLPYPSTSPQYPHPRSLAPLVVRLGA